MSDDDSNDVVMVEDTGESSQSSKPDDVLSAETERKFVIIYFKLNSLILHLGTFRLLHSC